MFNYYNANYRTTNYWHSTRYFSDLRFWFSKSYFKRNSYYTITCINRWLNGSKAGIADFHNASRNISALLDVEDVIKDKYFLEVYSAGNPLVKLTDYIKFVGKEANKKLNTLLGGRARYQEKIIKANDNKVYSSINNQQIVLAFDMILGIL